MIFKILTVLFFCTTLVALSRAMIWKRISDRWEASCMKLKGIAENQNVTLIEQKKLIQNLMNLMKLKGH